MRTIGTIIVGLCALAGCSFEIPQFLGRQGTGEGTYTLGGTPPPLPQPLALSSARVEPALRGVILRAEGVAPTQGYHSATFVAVGDGEPDTAGFLSFELTAVPPEETESVGPQRTRELSAAVFLPTGVARNIKGFRVSGTGSTQTLPIP